MAAPTIGGRPRWAPGPTTRINSGHPLAVGLIVIGQANVAYRGSRTRNPSSTPSVTRAPIASPFGRAMGDRTSDTDGGYVFPAPALGTTVTLMAIVNCTGASPEDSGAITWGDGAGGSGLLLGVGAANSTGPNIYCLSSAVAHHGTSTPIAQTGWRMIATSGLTGGGAGSMTIYLDGALISSQTADFTTGGTSIVVGSERSSGGVRTFDGQIATWAAWSRVLTANEHAALYANPFCMLDS